jgi:hypothetical protein
VNEPCSGDLRCTSLAQAGSRYCSDGCAAIMRRLRSALLTLADTTVDPTAMAKAASHGPRGAGGGKDAPGATGNGQVVMQVRESLVGCVALRVHQYPSTRGVLLLGSWLLGECAVSSWCGCAGTPRVGPGCA